MGTWGYILISLLFSAFFSGMEIAFISSNKLRHELDLTKKSWNNQILDIFYRNPNQFISTMLVGNNISLVVYGLQMAVLLEPAIAQIIGNQILIVLIQTLISTILILFAGEFIPKMIFKLNPNLSLRFFSFPLLLAYIILYPISKFSTLLSYLLLRIFGVNNIKDKTERILGKVDLNFFIQQHIDYAPQNSDIETEVKMFQNALDFSNVRLRNCIVPRTEMVACEKDTPIEELRSTFIETGLSKIVVYDENIDNVVGYIHSSELFKDPTDWTKSIRDISVVPETMAANKLMRLLMQNKRSMAVVVDEFGGVSGIITLEDLVEEIFGEIEDEHDMRSFEAKKIGTNEYLLSGRIEIDSLNEMFGLDLPESDDYVTIAGYILHLYQKFPKLNETLITGKYTFRIVKMTATKIELVRMKVEE